MVGKTATSCSGHEEQVHLVKEKTVVKKFVSSTPSQHVSWVGLFWRIGTGKAYFGVNDGYIRIKAPTRGNFQKMVEKARTFVAMENVVPASEVHFTGMDTNLHQRCRRIKSPRKGR